MDTLTQIKYLDARIEHAAEVFDLLERRGESQAASTLQKQLQDLRRQRQELAAPHTPSKNLVAGNQRAERFEDWVLEEWRRASIPQWQDILQDSIKQGDAKQEERARWMLRDILLDPDYQESAP